MKQLKINQKEVNRLVAQIGAECASYIFDSGITSLVPGNKSIRAIPPEDQRAIQREMREAEVSGDISSRVYWSAYNSRMCELCD